MTELVFVTKLADRLALLGNTVVNVESPLKWSLSITSSPKGVSSLDVTVPDQVLDITYEDELGKPISKELHLAGATVELTGESVSNGFSIFPQELTVEKNGKATITFSL